MVNFEVGYYVYLKLELYEQKTLRKKFSLKLSERNYGPFKVLKRLGEVDYRLELPPSSRLHSIFHVSVLKKKIENTSLIMEELPSFDDECMILLQPRVVLDYKVVTREMSKRKV